MTDAKIEPGKPMRRVEDTSETFEKVSPEKVAEALGGEEVKDPKEVAKLKRTAGPFRRLRRPY